MDPLVARALETWQWAPLLVVSVVLTAAVYTRGWLLLASTNPLQFNVARLTCFHAGLATILFALVSPLDALGEVRLSLHMVQHLLLMMVAPPLLWLGAPQLPLLRGLPRYVQRAWIGPLAAPGPVRSFFQRLGHPAVCWTLSVATIWLWHLPALYERALAGLAWHEAEHVSLLAAGMLFWWPVIQPYPSRARWPRWPMVPYLLLGDVQNTVFSALFCFSPEVFYGHYEALARFGGASALEDQSIAGAVMWIPGSILFLAPLAWLMSDLLAGSRQRRRSSDGSTAGQASSATRALAKCATMPTPLK